MAKRIGVGDVIKFRFYNTPEGKFYGPIHTGEIVEMATKDSKSVMWAKVKYVNDYVLWIKRNEYRGRIN